MEGGVLGRTGARVPTDILDEHAMQVRKDFNHTQVWYTSNNIRLQLSIRPVQFDFWSYGIAD